MVHLMLPAGARRPKEPSQDAALPRRSNRSPVKEPEKSGSKDDDDDELDW